MNNFDMNALENSFDDLPMVEIAIAIVLLKIKHESFENALSFVNKIDIKLRNHYIVDIARHLIANRQFDEAKSLLDKKDPDHMLLLVDIYIALNNEEQAKSLYKDLLKKHPKKRREDLHRRFVMAGTLYFPTPIFHYDITNAHHMNMEMIKLIYQWQKTDVEGLKKSNTTIDGSWHSQVNMHLLNEFKWIKDIISSYALEVSKELHYHNDYPLLLGNMWANISPKFGFNKYHTHPNCLWSGVYYVQVPDNSGRIKFSDPRVQALVIKPVYKDDNNLPTQLWNEVYYFPTPGRLLIFPAWLAHEVEQNLTPSNGPYGDRISISFNLHQFKVI